MNAKVEKLVEAAHLKKRYGAREVVRDVSLWVSPGEIVAIIGPNGAGKTTTLEIVLGLRSADSGVVRWSMPAFREQVGVQLQTTPFFPGLTARENLRVFGALYGLRLSQQETSAILARCGLTEAAALDAARLSGGQQKRLSIAIALVHQPKLLILDEPTAALDPRAQAEIRGLIKTLGQGGTAVVFSSHDMSEVSKLAERILIFDRGELRAEGDPRDLLRRYQVDSLEALYLRLTEAD